MQYFLKKNGDSRTLHINAPKVSLANSKFVLIIKDLTGKLLLFLEGISLPDDIPLDLLPGKYIMTLKNEEHFFSELIVA